MFLKPRIGTYSRAVKQKIARQNTFSRDKQSALPRLIFSRRIYKPNIFITHPQHVKCSASLFPCRLYTTGGGLNSLETVTNLLVRNNHEAAIRKCNELLELHNAQTSTLPQAELVQLWSFKADAQVQRGHITDAFESYKRALDLDPQNTLIALQVADMLLELKRFSEAKKIANKIIELEPDVEDGYSIKAASLVQSLEQEDMHIGRDEICEELLQCCDISLRLNPNQADIFINQSKAYRELRDYNKALAAAQAATSVDSDLPEAWKERSIVESQLGLMDQAAISRQTASSLTKV